MNNSDRAEKYFDQFPKIQDLILTTAYEYNELEENEIILIEIEDRKNPNKKMVI